MSYLFYIDSKNNKILHPDVIKLEPSLNLLDEKELLFIILSYDYNSMFRQFPERQRISKAIWHVYGDNKPELLNEESRSHRIKSAIEVYKSLQYNRNIELVEMYNKKIDSLIFKIEDEESDSALKRIRESIDGFRKDIRKLEEEIVEQKLMEGEIKGNVKLSWLEKLQQNQKLYKSLIAKKQA